MNCILICVCVCVGGISCFPRRSATMAVKGVPGMVFFRVVTIGLACMALGASAVHHILDPFSDLEGRVEKELEQRRKSAAVRLSS